MNNHFQDLDQDYVSIHIPSANGEWLRELHQRVTKALTKIVTDLDDDPEQPRTLLICTHAATMVSPWIQILLIYCTRLGCCWGKRSSLLARTCASPNVKDPLLTSIPISQIAAGRALTGKIPADLNEDDFQCYTASFSKYVRRSFEPEKGVAGNWDCVINSDTSYLSGGAERGW